MADLIRFSLIRLLSAEDILKGAPIITDNPYGSGGYPEKGHSSEVLCALELGCEESPMHRGITRSSGGFALGKNYRRSVVVIGNAPSALLSLCEMVKEGIRPAVIIGAPVGFVNAAECKKYFRTLSDVPSISTEGTRVAHGCGCGNKRVHHDSH